MDYITTTSTTKHAIIPNNMDNPIISDKVKTETRIVDKPLVTNISSNTTKNVLYSIRRVCKALGISQKGFMVLFVVCDSWVNEGKPMSCYGVCMALFMSKGNSGNVFQILDNFITMGLAEVVPIGNTTKYFGPTDKALKELSSLLG